MNAHTAALLGEIAALEWQVTCACRAIVYRVQASKGQETFCGYGPTIDEAAAALVKAARRQMEHYEGQRRMLDALFGGATAGEVEQ